MAYFYRLIFCWVAVFLSVLPVQATISPSGQYRTYYGGYYFYGNSSTEACEALRVYFAESSPTNTYTKVVDSQCHIIKNGLGYYDGVFSTVGGTCPDNATLSSGVCVCDAGFNEVDGQCVAPPPPPSQDQLCAKVAGMLRGPFNSPYVPGAPLNATFAVLCDPGSASTDNATCKVNVTYDFATQVGESWIKQGMGVLGGGSCTPTVEAPLPQPPASSPDVAPTLSSCPVGTFSGMVNGLATCVPPVNFVSAETISMAVAPVAGASAPVIADAPVGTESVTRSTTCISGVCTTTIVYKDGAGETLGSEAEVQNQTGFCDDNPSAPGCAEAKASKFSGACGAVPACEGDAIACAIAAQTLKTACALMTESDESALYDAEKVKVGNQTVDLEGNEVVAVGAAMFDQTNPFSGACISDRSIVVAGQTVVLPFSSVCSPLEMLGQLLLAVSFLLAARIVVRG